MNDVSDWWSTEIIEMEPGSISLRGEPVQNLIGNKSFVEMLWLMTTGEKLNQKKILSSRSCVGSSSRSWSAGTFNSCCKNVSYMRCGY